MAHLPPKYQTTYALVGHVNNVPPIKPTEESERWDLHDTGFGPTFFGLCIIWTWRDLYREVGS